MSNEYGDDFSNVKNVIYLVGKDYKDIENALKELTLPTKIISAYGMNGRHYMVIQSQNIVKKIPISEGVKKTPKTKTKKIKE